MQGCVIVASATRAPQPSLLLLCRDDIEVNPRMSQTYHSTRALAEHLGKSVSTSADRPGAAGSCSALHFCRMRAKQCHQLRAWMLVALVHRSRTLTPTLTLTLTLPLNLTLTLKQTPTPKSHSTLRETSWLLLSGQQWRHFMTCLSAGVGLIIL